MKKAVFLILSACLCAVVALAQDTTSGAAANQGQSASAMQSPDAVGNTIRGCLSGSSGNFTLTDQNGTQYRLVGDDTALTSKAGHEVEVNGTQNRSMETTNANGEEMARAGNNFQVSDVKDISSNCHTNPGSAAQPMNESTRPGDEANPKGTGTTEPPRPQLLAQAQQPASPAGTGEDQNTNSSGSMSSPTTSTSQSSQSVDSAPQQSNPPVSSQTPAAQNPPTNSNSQLGSTPANAVGTTPGEAERNAQAAQQGQLSTNPQTGVTTGRGVNNQGVNNPSQTVPPPNANPPQTNNNDQNKPLYERQATDIPWASHSGTTDQNSNVTPPR